MGIARRPETYAKEDCPHRPPATRETTHLVMSKKGISP